VRHQTENNRIIACFKDNKRRKYTKSESNVTNPVDDHCFDGRFIGLQESEPEVDQQVRAQTNPLPTKKQLNEIVSRYEHQHKKSEK